MLSNLNGKSLVWTLGTLPVGMEQCTINIKASPAGHYEFPENTHLVSGVYWFDCRDVDKFNKPITVEIEHCAKNISGLAFVKTSSSHPYTFKPISGGNFMSKGSYGVIDLNSFCKIAITQTEPEERDYCSTLFYNNQKLIDFVITWNLEVQRNVS